MVSSVLSSCVSLWYHGVNLASVRAIQSTLAINMECLPLAQNMENLKTMNKIKNIYVGHNKDTSELDVIYTDATPESANEKGFESYSWLIGEFKTLRGARFYQTHGLNNPHVQNVNDAERIAKEINFAVYATSSIVNIFQES